MIRGRSPFDYIWKLTIVGPFTMTPSRSAFTTPPTSARTSQAMPGGALSSEMKYLPSAPVIAAQRMGGPIVMHAPFTGAPPLVTVPLIESPFGFGVGVGAGWGVGGGGVGCGVGGGGGGGVGCGVAGRGVGGGVGTGVGAGVAGAGVGAAVGAVDALCEGDADGLSDAVTSADAATCGDAESLESGTFDGWHASSVR